MAAPDGLTRGRVLLIAGGVLVLAALVGFWQWGNGALDADGSGLTTTRISADGSYGGVPVSNDSDFPVTLKEFRAGDLDNAEVLQAVVVRPERNHGWTVLTPPLSASTKAVVDAGRPIDGFVLPARSTGYQIVYRLRPIDATRTASIDGGTVVYSSVTGIGHTARTDLQVCLRASSGACPSAG